MTHALSPAHARITQCTARVCAVAAFALAACQPQHAPTSGAPRGMADVRDTLRFDTALPDTHVAVGAAYRVATAPIPLPDVEREFRGVWIATVHNIDWPSRRDLTTAQAQRELVRILDAARDLGLNAVIFQVRPAADALYASPIEPWSDFLTGQSGRAPDPFWDPLEFAVEQAHARGLELHAWFNPFRAGFIARTAQPAANHVRRRRPDLVRRYGSHYWMDPAEPDARQQAMEVISDVVRRYDIDAVHIDDYFYPYQERDSRGRLITFPDDATWQRHGRSTGMTRPDWRRANIDAFVELMYRTVHEIKPHVRVGISPFGIWRPGHPESVRGLDAYAELFADSRKWIANGWADYFAPQLYWRTRAPQQDYSALLGWWVDQNHHNRHIWAGNIPNNVTGRASGWRASEILEQVRLTRTRAGAGGNIHFSATGLFRNADGIGDELRTRLYAQPALVPASPWLSAGPAAPPDVTITPDEGDLVVLLPTLAVRPTAWIVRARWQDDWSTQILPGPARDVRLEARDGRPADVVAVSSVDRAGVESPPTTLVRAAHQ